jgi:hypothetical protein
MYIPITASGGLPRKSLSNNKIAGHDFEDFCVVLEVPGLKRFDWLKYGIWNSEM